ncbi:DUF805 domain-containing protein [Arthrobacter oryzae]|uniref:DUF805 domain-containing protein n=1 Tax=Arthrobacter oryzae TaxID=409290 RepID=UPI002789E1E8|nr:DUF805 domain-containing protein [Arthrobacter oryzae]MDQ0075773.1 uncharacterized membrane protein YhaH (DUF805 family) [Arthrobacter oryzae]
MSQQYPQQQTPQQTWQGGEPPLWAPYYGAPFPAAVKRFFKKYATFSGRASRSEYWWWTLVAVAVSFILNIIMGVGTTATTATAASTAASGPGTILGTILIVIWAAATIVPSFALAVRRLHDGNFSGWLVLIVLVPLVGALALLVLMILPSKPAGQRFDQPASA